MNTQEINIRYTELADTECCLSCGNAANLSESASGEVCIDLGSGKGTDVLRLAEKVGSEGFVYGVDISDGMIVTARRMAEKFNVTNVRFVQSDLESIPVASEVANLIISNCTINHVANKQAVWNEIFRLLKQDGRFIISDIYSTSEIPIEYKHDPVAIAECWGGAIQKEEYLQIIRTAGFKNAVIIEESKPYSKGKTEVVSFTVKGEKSGN